MQAGEAEPVVVLLCAGRRQCRRIGHDDEDRRGLHQISVLWVTRVVCIALEQRQPCGPSSRAVFDCQDGFGGDLQTAKYIESAPPASDLSVSSTEDED